MLSFSIGGCSSSVPEFELQEIDPRVIVEFELTNGDDVVSLNQEFIDDMGYNVKITELKYLISDLQLEAADGSLQRLEDIQLIDHKAVDETLETPQWARSYKYSIPPGEYLNLRFGLGVKPDLNTTDPTTLPNDDALSLYGGMHWTWATMFKFVVLHAKIDTLGGSDFSHEVTFETGLDSLYRPDLSYPVNLSLKSFDRDTIRLKVDWNKIFHSTDPIDLTTDNISHTFGSVEAAQLAVRFTDNYVKAIELD